MMKWEQIKAKYKDRAFPIIDESIFDAAIEEIKTYYENDKKELYKFAYKMECERDNALAEIRSLKRLLCIIRYYFISTIIGLDILGTSSRGKRNLLIDARDYWKKKAEEYK